MILKQVILEFESHMLKKQKDIFFYRGHNISSHYVHQPKS